jgi:predicted membrane protein
MADFDREEWRKTMRAQREELRQKHREHRDEWRQYMRENMRGHRSGAGGLVVGLILAGIGVLLLLQNLGILYVDDLWMYWPVILIALGVSKAATAYGFGGRIWGGAMAIVGGVFLLRNFDIIHGNAWNFVWPVILIFAGIAMLARHLDGHQPWSGTAAVPPIASDKSTADRLNISTVFHGVERRIETQDFEGGQLEAVFGGIDIDLSRAATKKEQVVIEANAVFGGINLRVPDSWNTTVRGTGVFGGYEDKTIPSRSPDPKAPRLIVTGSAVFGGVIVRN